MKARALRRGQVTGLIAPVQTTRLTGGYDLYKAFTVGGGAPTPRKRNINIRSHRAGTETRPYDVVKMNCQTKCNTF